MKKTAQNAWIISLAIGIGLSLAVPAAGQAQAAQFPSPTHSATAGRLPDGHSISVQAAPVLTMPLADSATLFGTSGGGTLEGEYAFPGGAIRPFAGLRLEYALAPFKADDSLSILSFEAAGGASFQVLPRLTLEASGTAGYFLGIVNSDGSTGSNPAFAAGLGLSFLSTPALDLSAGAAYRNYLGLYHGVSIRLGAAVFLAGKGERLARIEAAAPARVDLLAGEKLDKPGMGLDMDRLELDEVFPVFRSYYDDRPIGRVLIINREDRPIEGIRLSVYIKQYMDAPKECPAPASLGSRESLMVNLTSLFTDRILSVTEATKATAEVVLEYSLDGQLYRAARNVTVRILDRNAMRWDDDSRAAAFVTAKDPRVLAFSKNVAGIVRDAALKSADGNLQMGMGMYKALDLYGLSYAVDPKTPYVEYSKGAGAVDFLQFPRQTLEYRAGDCDDLSILLAALLESIGIETAFITVPGHIFMAFALDVPPGEVPRSLSNPGELIIRDDKAWVPVEVTERKQGFLAAWQIGIREWREAEAAGSARFVPIHEAWREYEPVGLPDATPDISLPPADSIATAFLKESARFVDRELFPMVQKLEAEMKAGGDTPAAHNRLGVLYARYDRFEQAATEFRAALSKGDYPPALLNLGNLHYLKKDYALALDS